MNQFLNTGVAFESITSQVLSSSVVKYCPVALRISNLLLVLRLMAQISPRTSWIFLAEALSMLRSPDLMTNLDSLLAVWFAATLSIATNIGLSLWKRSCKRF